MSFNRKQPGDGLGCRGTFFRVVYRLTGDTVSCLCLVLGLPAAQEVSEHSILSGSSVEGQIHGEYQRPGHSFLGPSRSLPAPSGNHLNTDDVIMVVVCFQPFYNGLVTVMVPQLRRENSLLLWSTLDLNSPVHAFVGHDDVVLEFQWRPQKEGDHRPVRSF